MNANQESIIQRLLSHEDLLGELVPRSKGDPRIKAELDVLVQGADEAMACVRAGLYLRFNFLDDSHKVSQGIATAEGSYWHAIMHRREPDYSNSKHWYRRVGRHAVFQSLDKLAVVTKALGAAKYDPFAFVDYCEEAEHNSDHYRLAVEIQRAEWRALFEHCLDKIK